MLVFYICLSIEINIFFQLFVDCNYNYVLFFIANFNGSWGVREGVFAIALNALSIPVESSIAFSVVFRLHLFINSVARSFLFKEFIYI